MKCLLFLVCGILTFSNPWGTKAIHGGNGGSNGTNETPQDTTQTNNGIEIIGWSPIEIGGGGGEADDAD